MRRVLYEFLAAAGQSMSPETTASAGRRLGRLIWKGIRSRREYAVSAVKRHLDVDDVKARSIARESFEQSGQSFLEILQVRHAGPRFMAEQVENRNPEVFRFLQREKRPAICVTGHFGGWEFMSCCFMNTFPQRHLIGVVRRPKDEAMHLGMMHLRTHPWTSIVSHRNAAPKVLRVLKKQGMAGFLVDHNCSRREALFLPFLGDVAAVNRGPALLAVRAEALIVPAFLRRVGAGRYTLYMEDPLDIRDLAGDREEKVPQAAAFYTRHVEEYVRRYPEQWFWMHKRWKTRPPTES